MKEEGVMALHLPNEHLKPRSGLENIRDANSVPTSPLADNLATAPSGPVCSRIFMFLFISALCSCTLACADTSAIWTVCQGKGLVTPRC